MLKKVLLAIVLLVGFCFSAVKEYKIIPVHSYIDFTIKHFTFSKVRGKIKDFKGMVKIDDKKGIKAIDLTAEVKSIDTANKKRDDHLRNPDFFEVKKFPKATLTLNNYMGDRRSGKVYGKLMIKGISKEVIFDATISEEIDNPKKKGGKVVALELVGEIMRKDFKVGMTYPNAMLSHKVQLEVALQLMK